MVPSGRPASLAAAASSGSSVTYVNSRWGGASANAARAAATQRLSSAELPETTTTRRASGCSRNAAPSVSIQSGVISTPVTSLGSVKSPTESTAANTIGTRGPSSAR